MADMPINTAAAVSAPLNPSLPCGSHDAFGVVLEQLEEALWLEQLAFGGFGDPSMSQVYEDASNAWTQCETSLLQFVASPDARPLTKAAADLLLSALLDEGRSKADLWGYVEEAQELSCLATLVGKPISTRTVTQLRCATKLIGELVEAAMRDAATSDVVERVSLTATAA
ncbi:hypothetical protein [uncultured Shimia sp.]|uniref:hypothetical protein n=1 Tax=uncultured Shimia sp. TaxID=573152 RepID=UPI00260BDDA4|nr:hypothetical protein [uncultured Shimia sp.]